MVLDKTRVRVAFQGERGAFSEEAAVSLLGEEIELVPSVSFGELFSSITLGYADYIVAPVENSLYGPIDACLGALAGARLRIDGEVSVAINQCLIARPGASIGSLHTVVSHPVALGQCRRFFEVNRQIHPIAADDTAGSVRVIMEQSDPGIGAIASERAAALYEAEVLMKNIEDRSDNYTRFLLLSDPSTQPGVLKNKQVYLSH